MTKSSNKQQPAEIPLTKALSPSTVNDNGGGLSSFAADASITGRARRNVWSEAKNAALVSIVKNHSWSSTPWRPRHGTNKEIWEKIASQMSEMSEVFDVAIHCKP